MVMSRNIFILLGGMLLIGSALVLKEIVIPAMVVKQTINPSQMLSKAHDAKRFDDIRQLQRGLGEYYVLNQKYPLELSELISAQILISIPPDPDTSNPYSYTVNTNQSDYSLCATYSDMGQQCVTSKSGINQK